MKSSSSKAIITLLDRMGKHRYSTRRNVFTLCCSFFKKIKSNNLNRYIAAINRFGVLRWIYRPVTLFIGIPLFVMLYTRLKDSVTDDFNLTPLAATDTYSPIASTTLSFGASRGITHQKQISISGTERPQMVDEICRTLDASNTTDVLHLSGTLLLNQSLYYCNITKCGSTFMFALISDIFKCNGRCDEVSVSSNTDIVRRNSVTQSLISNAYSFMFVREPYARLFSAYENKLFLPNTFWRILGKDVIKTVRPRASRVSKMLGHDVTFRELVSYVVNLYERGITLNSHITPMQMLCDPCTFSFNFIGKLETMSSDLDELVEDWKYKGIISNNISSVKETETKLLYKRSLGPFRHLFKTLRKFGEHLSRYKMFQRTWSSYQIRGLILKKYSIPFVEKEAANVTYGKFEAELKNALDESKTHQDDLKTQREEALIQAYSSVPMDLMLKLKEFMKPDCLLFGYDVMPKLLFNRVSVKSSAGYDYFKGL